MSRLDPDSDYAYDPSNMPPPEPDGVSCRGCDHFILDASDEVSHKHHGWWWCADCYSALPEIIEGRVRAARADERRDR